MGEFLCANSDMYFYSNPYMDMYIEKEAKQNHIKFELTCEAFETEDQVVVHYFMDKDLKYRKGFEPELIEDEKL
jgi:hypothetical protein